MGGNITGSHSGTYLITTSIITIYIAILVISYWKNRSILNQLFASFTPLIFGILLIFIEVSFCKEKGMLHGIDTAFLLFIGAACSAFWIPFSIIRVLKYKNSKPNIPADNNFNNQDSSITKDSTIDNAKLNEGSFKELSLNEVQPERLYNRSFLNEAILVLIIIFICLYLASVCQSYGMSYSIFPLVLALCLLTFIVFVVIVLYSIFPVYDKFTGFQVPFQKVLIARFKYVYYSWAIFLSTAIILQMLFNMLVT